MELDQQRELERLLKEEIQKTIASVEEYQELTQPIAPDDAIGRITRMDAINNKSVNEASLRQAKQKLVLLKENLKNIDQKDFGLCLKCKRSIPMGRLVLMPQSRYCVNCAN